MAPQIELPDIEVEEQTREKTRLDKGWRVIVWNDHVNLMSYVVYVFQKVLRFDREKAKKHMLEVHHQGRSCVATEPREKAELYYSQLLQHGLRTTLEKAP
jgi:ATP-dependent Clp protease adaptor protein ClpS